MYGISALHDHILFFSRKKFRFGYRSRNVTKVIKLSIFLNSENNSNILSPILGQYGIKPVDFLDVVKQKFFKGNEEVLPVFINENLVLSLYVEFGKNNTYNIILRKFEMSYLYNVFCQNYVFYSKIYFNLLFICKMITLQNIVFVQSKSLLIRIIRFLF